MQSPARTLTLLACTTFFLVSPADVTAQQACRIERSISDEAPLEVTPLAARELRVELARGVALVAEVTADGAVSAVARGSLELEVDPASLRYRTRGVATTKVRGPSTSSTVSSSLWLTAPRLSPDADGVVLFDATIADEVDVSGLALACGDMVVGLREGDESDAILSQVGAVYPRQPSIVLSTADPSDRSFGQATLRLVANDTVAMPLVVAERREHDGVSLVRLHSKLGVVIAGWIRSEELTSAPLGNVDNGPWFGVRGVGRGGVKTAALAQSRYRGPAKLVAGAQVFAGPSRQGFAKVSGPQSMEVLWVCGEKRVQIFPADIRVFVPTWVAPAAVTLPAGADPCATGRGAP